MSGSATKTQNEFLAMSDDDILNMVGPPEVTAEVVVEEPVVDEQAEPVIDPVTEDPAADGEQPGDEEGEAVVEPVNPLDVPDDKIDDAKPVDKAVVADPVVTAEPVAEPVVVDPAAKVEEPVVLPIGSAPKVPTTPEEFEGAYKQIMAPFKANGKTIELKTPEEAIQLMQMGANYTKKLQEIQPHRKMLLMLQNNGLLDEGKLSFLIDVDRKDPEAIKKLIKDSGIDPMDIDTSVESAYREGNHLVADEEVGFRTTLEEITSLPSGKETVSVINSTWDDASKEVLWAKPDIMPIIHEQRENGIYDLITAEMDRQKMLGQIPQSTSFLQAYKIAGDALAAANAFASIDQTQPIGSTADTPAAKLEPVVVTTKAAVPKSQVVNGDKVSAAASTRGTPRTVKAIVNPLAMSDDDFMKLEPFTGRL